MGKEGKLGGWGGLIIMWKWKGGVGPQRGWGPDVERDEPLDWVKDGDDGWSYSLLLLLLLLFLPITPNFTFASLSNPLLATAL